MAKNVKNLTHLVTGSTDGIGSHTCKRLAREGRPLIVHGRNPQRVKSAVEQIKKSAADPKLPIHGITADFSSLDEVRKLAHEVKTHLDGAPLGVLDNNAGVYELKKSMSKDGMEMTWAVNVAAPFLLTSLLLDTLPEGGRILNVASISAGSTIDFNNLQMEKGFSAHSSYSLSKLANIIFDLQLAKRLSAAGKGITANTCDPGTVNTKMLLAGWGPCGIPVHEANDQHWLITDPSLEGVTGQYFVGRRPCRPPSTALDESIQQKLWAVLEEQTGAQWSI